jgi:hypothetical protein
MSALAVFESAAPAFRWGRIGDDYFAEWPGVLRLRAAIDGEIREFFAWPNAPPDRVEKVRRGAATAFVRALMGKSSLHASAVALGDSALVCIGPSGAGKSTLAATLCKTHGAELLADDVTGLEFVTTVWHAIPSEATIWVAGEGHDPNGLKRAVRFAAAESSKAIVWAVQLSFDDSLGSVEVRPLHGARPAAAFLSALMRFNPRPALMKQELDFAAGMAAQSKVFEVARPRLTSVDVVARALLNVTSVGSNKVSISLDHQ